MIKRIYGWLAKVQKSQAQKLQLKKMQAYYRTIRQGLLAIQYIQKELADTKNEMNRHSRRRMEKSLIKGEITPEIVNSFISKMDYMLVAIEERLSPPKAGKVKINGKQV